MRLMSPRMRGNRTQTGPRTARAGRGSAVILLLTLALTGCGAGPSESPSGQDGSATRMVLDAEGTEIAVPTTPRRVVALSEPTLDGALALNVTPVGTITGRGQSTVPGYLGDRAGDIPVLGGVAQPNFEKIATARPDLILVDGSSINNNPEAIGVLRKIAPTVVTGYAGADWRTNFHLVGEALNKADEARAVMNEYDEAVAAAKPDLARYAGKTFSIVRWQGSSASLILKELPGGIALDDLGLTRPPAQDRQGRGHSEPVSLENLDQIDADYLFFGTLGGSSSSNRTAGGASDVTGAEKALGQAAKVPGFTDLVAYRTEHVIPVDGSRWTSTGGPLLMRGLVADVVEALG